MSNATIQTGTTHSYENCPRCSSEGSMILETYITGEQAGNCGSCGYQFSRKVLLGDNKQPILDSQNQFMYTQEEIKEPYGAIHIISKDEDDEGHKACQMYSVPSEKEYTENILPFIEQNMELIDEAILSQFIDGKIIRTSLLTKKQEDEI
jgi:transcription elongation factor Elf1